ncbi:LOW QUALITY PROTEIN: predicted protein, partial [Neisseria gonorrhoeae SK-92-679]
VNRKFATEPSVPGWRPHRGKCRHSPRFFTYRADAANFCRFVCAKGALYKIIRRTNNRAEMKMPYPMGRLRTLKGSGGICIPCASNRLRVKRLQKSLLF